MRTCLKVHCAALEGEANTLAATMITSLTGVVCVVARYTVLRWKGKRREQRFIDAEVESYRIKINRRMRAPFTLPPPI